MSSYKHFQSDNFKYEKNRTDIYNPDFVSAVKAKDDDKFLQHLHKWSDFIAWSRWFPDLWFDLITPETGGIRLDLDQRVFLRSLCRFLSTYGVFPRGYGKCVTGDTLLFTNDGITEIGEYFNNIECDEEILTTSSIELLNRYGKIEKSIGGIYSGLLPTKQIITEEGYNIEGTFNHPVLIMNKDGKIVFKTLEEINVGDYVAINRNNDLWGNKFTIDADMDSWLNTLSNHQTSHLNIRKMPDMLDRDLALYIGYLIGDGCLTLEDEIYFSNIDKEILRNFFKISKYKFKAKVFEKANGVDYVIYDKYMRKYLELIGLHRVNAHHKEIPKIIMQSPKSFVAKCLQGLFDTDGTVESDIVRYCTVSEKLANQIQILLLNFGIISNRTKYYDKSGRHCFRISIYGENIDKYNKMIGFSSKIKRDKLLKIIKKKRRTNKDIIPYQAKNIKQLYEELKQHYTYITDIYNNIKHAMLGDIRLTYDKLEYLLQLDDADKCPSYDYLKTISDNHYFFSKVKTINNSENHVYDLSLPDTHSFVSNGFISHNTFIEVLAMYHTAIFYPDITLSMSSTTKENAATLLKDKHSEIIRFYPLIGNEITKSSFSKDKAEILFTSGAVIDNLANSQATKGQRRRRLNLEESALLNNVLFKDALEPVVNVPRRTIGKQCLVNPEEINGQINFLSTSGFRGTDEFVRNLQMVNDMINLKGKMVLGASWHLGVHYGRGETKGQILAKKDDVTSSPIAFAQNYESKWVKSDNRPLMVAIS